MIMIIRIGLIIILIILLNIAIWILYRYYRKQIDEIEYRILILEKKFNLNREYIKCVEKDEIIDNSVLKDRIEKLERKINKISKGK